MGSYYELRMGVTKEEMLDAIGRPIVESFDAEGITQKYLAKKLKKELNAKEVKTFKGKVTTTERPGVGYPTVTEKEEVIYSKSLVAWDIRQKARQDAHKLRGDYPPEKKEIAGFDGKDIKFIIEYDGDGNGSKGSPSETP